MSNKKHHGPSYKEASEAIASFWNSFQTEKVYTGDEVYNYSPSGQLFMIPGWYNEARMHGFVGADDTRTDVEFKASLEALISAIKPELLNPKLN